MTESVKVTQADRDLLEEIKNVYWPMASDDKALAVIARHRTAAQPEREAVLEEWRERALNKAEECGNFRGALDVLQLAADEINGEIDRQIYDEKVALSDWAQDYQFDVQLSAGQIDALNSAICAAQTLLKHAALTTPTSAETGRERLAKQIGIAMANRADLPDPLIVPAVSTDEAIEQIVVGFSDKAILRLDIDEDDPRLSLICDEMRGATRAILSHLRGEGE